MAGLAWLTARPIAHRGLHDASAGVIESTASAFSAAIAGGYGMETDLQISTDGEAMVHHDDALGRLTEGSGRLCDMAAAEIKRVRFKTSAARILTLGELCDLVGGRATLVLELKSHFDGDRRLVRGIVAERHYAHHEWDRIPRSEKRRMAFLLHANRTRPQFIAYGVKDLPAAAPLIARAVFGLPLLTWTVRSDDDRRRAARWADQMIFEGIRP